MHLSKSVLYIVLLLLISNIQCIQSHNNDKPVFYNSIYEPKGKDYYIYSDTASIRQGPGTAFQEIEKLTCGTQIRVLQDQDENTKESIGQLSYCWFLIEYQKNGQTKQGYIWGHDICVNQLQQDDVKFVFGIDSVVPTGNYYNYLMQVKAVRNDSVIARKQIETYLVNLIGAQIRDSIGLKGVDKTIIVSFSNEGCGSPNTDHFFVWNGSNLKYLLREYSIGDGGIYSYGESYLFEKNSNLAVKLISYYQADEDSTGNYTDDGVLKYKTEIYKWDGDKLNLQDQNWDSSKFKYVKKSESDLHLEYSDLIIKVITYSQSDPDSTEEGKTKYKTEIYERGGDKTTLVDQNWDSSKLDVFP